MTAWTISNAGASNSNYRGNPEITIASAPTGSILSPRTSGMLPYFHHVSASQIAGSGASHPWEDFSYFWNFGDTAGTEIFSSTASGISKNANNGQAGPDAVYCYRQVGTYTVTLTVFCKKTGGGYVSQTFTQTVTVTPFVAAVGNTWYYDAASAGGNGTTAALSGANAAFASINGANGLTAKITGATGAAQIYLARGSHWTNTVANDPIDFTPPAATPLRVSPPPGSVGADPIIELNGDSKNGIWSSVINWLVTTGMGNLADIVVSHVTGSMTGTPTNVYGVFGGNVSAPATLNYLYWDNCTANTLIAADPGHGLSHMSMQCATAPSLMTGFGIWGGSMNSLPGDHAYGTSFFGGGFDWNFFMGISNINGSGSADFVTYDSRQHHIYLSVRDHLVCRWIGFGSGNENKCRDFCIKVDYYPPPNTVKVGSIGPGISNGAGGNVIRCTLSAGVSTYFVEGDRIYIDNWQGTSAADISNAYGSFVGEGIWTNHIVNTTTIDLIGTTYNAAHNYTTGTGEMSPVGGANYWLIDDCDMHTTAAGFNGSNNHGNANASWVSSYIVQDCAFHDHQRDLFNEPGVALSFTMRRCRGWNNFAGYFGPTTGLPKNPSVRYQLYGNQFCRTSSSSIDADNGMVQIPAQSGVVNQAQLMVDNILVDHRVNAGIFVTHNTWASHISLGSVFDRNSYWAPNATLGKMFFEDVSQKTFAQLFAAGFEQNGTLLSARPSNWLTNTPTQWSDFGP